MLLTGVWHEGNKNRKAALSTWTLWTSLNTRNPKVGTNQLAFGSLQYFPRYIIRNRKVKLGLQLRQRCRAAISKIPHCAATMQSVSWLKWTGAALPHWPNLTVFITSANYYATTHKCVYQFVCMYFRHIIRSLSYTPVEYVCSTRIWE